MLAQGKNTVKGCCTIRLHANLPQYIVTHVMFACIPNSFQSIPGSKHLIRSQIFLWDHLLRSWHIEILWFCVTPMNSLMSIVHNRVLAPVLTLDTSSALSLPEKPAWGNWLCMAQDHKLHTTSDHQGNGLSQEMSFQPSEAGKYS